MSKVNINGAWKDLDKVFVNIGGVWKEVEKMFCNIGGVWKEVEGLSKVRIFISYRNKYDSNWGDKRTGELNPSTYALIRTSNVGSNMQEALGSINGILYSIWGNTDAYTTCNPETFAIIENGISFGLGRRGYSRGCDISSNDNYMYLSFYVYSYDDYGDYYGINVQRRNKSTFAILSGTYIEMGGYGLPELVGGSGVDLYGGTSQSTMDKIYERNATTLAIVRNNTSNPFTSKMAMQGIDTFDNTIYVGANDIYVTPFKVYMAEVNKSTFTRIKQVQLSGMEYLHGMTILK